MSGAPGSAASGPKSGVIKMQSLHNNVMRGKYLKDVRKWNKDKEVRPDRFELARHSSVD